MLSDCESVHCLIYQDSLIFILDPAHASARQDGVIPFHKPIIGLDGAEMHEVAVPRGTTIFVSIFNANRNPDLWGKGN